MIRERSLLADASTTAYRVVWNLGGGTDAHSRVSKESGSRSIANVPSENGFLSAIRTSPSGPSLESCRGGRRPARFGLGQGNGAASAEDDTRLV